MTTSNKSNPPGAGHNPYARFIPREELGTVSAWNLETFEPAAKAPEEGGVRKPTLAERAAAEIRPVGKAGATARHAQQTTARQPASASAAGAAAPSGTQKPAAARPVVGGVPGQTPPQAQPAARPTSGPAEAEVTAMVQEARQSGYQDGYRNGLAALESYKQTQAAQMAAFMSDQVGAVVGDLHHRLEALEQQLAGRVARVALELARQVVRAEIQQHPEHVVEVAEQALGALLSSARQIVLRLHPEDHVLVQAQLAETLGARGVRLLPDAGLGRGGCVVESDLATVDATVEARWERAAAALGQRSTWQGGREPVDGREVPLPEDGQDGEEWMQNDVPRTSEGAGT